AFNSMEFDIHSRNAIPVKDLLKAASTYWLIRMTVSANINVPAGAQEMPLHTRQELDRRILGFFLAFFMFLVDSESRSDNPNTIGPDRSNSDPLPCRNKTENASASSVFYSAFKAHVDSLAESQFFYVGIATRIEVIENYSVHILGIVVENIVQGLRSGLCAEKTIGGSYDAELIEKCTNLPALQYRWSR